LSKLDLGLADLAIDGLVAKIRAIAKTADVSNLNF